MKKRLFTVLASLILTTSLLAAVNPYSYELNVSFNVDDFEESASNLVVQGVSSNTNVVPVVTVTKSDTNDHEVMLYLQSIPANLGVAQISLNVCDNGYQAARTPLMSITPDTLTTTNVNSTNWATFTLIGSDNRVDLSWYPAATTQFGYKINRYSTNNIDVDKRFTIGTTTETNFVDTNVVNGNTYWYTVTWIPVDSLPQPTNVVCAEYVFEVRNREPVPLRAYPPNGLYFISRSNTIYQVYYKTNMLQKIWKLWSEIDTPKDKAVVLIDDSDFFRNNIIYVREKE